MTINDFDKFRVPQAKIAYLVPTLLSVIIFHYHGVYLMDAEYLACLPGAGAHTSRQKSKTGVVVRLSRKLECVRFLTPSLHLAALCPRCQIAIACKKAAHDLFLIARIQIAKNQMHA